jgi:hypothetical protein
MLHLLWGKMKTSFLSFLSSYSLPNSHQFHTYFISLGEYERTTTALNPRCCCFQNDTLRIQKSASPCNYLYPQWSENVFNRQEQAAVKNSTSMKFHLPNLVVISQQLYEKHRKFTYGDEL